MPSGLGDSKLNQLEGKDDIEDDRVDLVKTCHRPRSNDQSNSIPNEIQCLPGYLHPQTGPSKTATKIAMPMRVNTVKERLQGFGPRPGSTLHKTAGQNYGNTASRKRELTRSAQMPSSEQSRPRKQQKTISAMEEPSVDTDDDDSMEMDVPYSHRNQKIREQQQTTREDTSQSKNIPPNNRADLAFVKDINDIAQVDTKGPTSSTHAGALQKKNDPSRWTSRTPQGDIQPTKWNHQLKKPASARQRGRGSTLFKMKFNLLCFQHGIDSYNAEEDSCSLFIQLSPDRVLATFYGETGKEKKVWGIDLTDVGAVAQVLVDTLQRRFAIILKQRSCGTGEPGRTVMFHLKTGEDIEDCKSGFFSKGVGCTPTDADEKKFDALTNKLKVWKHRSNARGLKLPLELATPRQHQTRQEKKKTSDVSVEIPVRRSARNQMDNMEKNSSKRTRASSADDFEVSPGGMQSVKPKFELPKPRWKKSLVYPPTGPKREIIDYDDLNRLNSNEFLNDNIVNFYLRYIEVQLQKKNPELAKETYFLNTFFYERLTKRSEKGKREVGPVLKWTAKVDIFKTSYIVIPINESSHWYLAIICNLCNLERKMKDKLPNSPGSRSIDLESNETLAEAKEDDQDALPRNILGLGDAVESELTSATRDDEQDVKIVETRDSLELMALDEVPRKEDKNTAADSSDREIIELEDSSSQKSKPKAKGKSKAKAKPPHRKTNYMPPDTPSIIILDSMGYGTTSHMPTIKNLREYLAAEALNKRNLEITRDDIDAAYAKVPNQNNWYDCGLFLLHYVERFFDDPKEFAAMFLARQNRIQDQGLWRKEEIGGMREKLFDLFIKLHAEQEAVEMEQKGFQQREKVNGNESKSQKAGEGKVLSQDVMVIDVEGSVKDKNQRKRSASEHTDASKDIGFEKFTGELEDLITSGAGDQHREEDVPADLASQVTDQPEIQPINLEGSPNSILQPPRGVTLSFRGSREGEGVIT